MVIDSAGQQPVSGVVGSHFSRDAGAWKQADGVCVAAACGQDLAVEMNRVHVHLGAHTQTWQSMKACSGQIWLNTDKALLEERNVKRQKKYISHIYGSN